MDMEHLEGLIPISDWFEVFDGGLTVISGPCSAESKQQVMETAGALSGIKQVKALRAGIWKHSAKKSTASTPGCSTYWHNA